MDKSFKHDLPPNSENHAEDQEFAALKAAMEEQKALIAKLADAKPGENEESIAQLMAQWREIEKRIDEAWEKYRKSIHSANAETKE